MIAIIKKISIKEGRNQKHLIIKCAITKPAKTDIYIT